MAQQANTGAAKQISAERQMLKRSLTLLPLFGIIFFTVCGGTFGIESVFAAGAGMALLLICITPIVYSIPNMLMVRELQSMMPVEGSYYHWTKQAFGPGTGFLTGWMNWVMSWVDVSIYPVFAVTYLGQLMPWINNDHGALPAWALQWIIAIVIIWLISLLQMRGARLAGLTSVWLGVILLIPIVIMTVLGFYNWGAHGSGYHMSFLATGTGTGGALALGLWVVMWNFMGWELPTAAGDEIVKPKRTYPLAMVLVLVAAIAVYILPTVAAMYGGAGDNGQIAAWGIEASDESVGVGADLEAAGMTSDQIQATGIDTSGSEGWFLPSIGKAVAEKTTTPGSGFAGFLGGFLTLGAVLSMIGLFIGNSVSATRVPFALSEDGMMPKGLVRVHRKWGTPWMAIILCGVVFTAFSYNRFSNLVVIDVLLNSLTLLLQFAALWRLRFKMPNAPRNKVPGGWGGLTIFTIMPAALIGAAIYWQVRDSGWWAIWGALITVGAGIIIYFIMKFTVKKGVPDIDPFESGEAEQELGEPIPVRVTVE
jgi:amino acid transporter